MTKLKVHFLDSLIEMTQHRDSELIAKSLVKTLYELVDAQKIELFAIHKVKKSLVLNLLARVDSNGVFSKLEESTINLSDKENDAIIQCIKNKEITILNLPKSEEIQVNYPVLDKMGDVVNILIKHCSENSIEDQRLTDGILQLYHNYLSILEESQKDRLTGLLNRETFITAINKIITSYNERKKEPQFPKSRRRSINGKACTYWLGLLDIDHFKSINDRFGHLYGDEVILLLVRIMRDSFRKDDLLFRYGGEEFMVVLKVPSKKDAVSAFERFRKAVANYDFQLAGQITISIGYVQITGEDFPLTAVGKADKALYYAKENGRNCGFCYEDLVEEGKITIEEEYVETEDDFELF